jgi:hypothetical protein
MFFARSASLVLPRSLMHRGGKARIPAPPTASARNDEALIGLRKLKSLLTSLIVVHDRTDRNLKNDVPALAPCSVRTFAMPATFCSVLRIETKMHEGVVALARFHHDVAALAAITAGRPATRHKLLPAEGHAAVAAVAGFDSNFGFINEHGKAVLGIQYSKPSHKSFGQSTAFAVPLKAAKNAGFSR